MAPFAYKFDVDLGHGCIDSADSKLARFGCALDGMPMKYIPGLKYAYERSHSKIPSTFADPPVTNKTRGFILSHWDTHMGNILVNPDTFAINGMIDWEFVRTSPLWMVKAPRYLHCISLESSTEPKRFCKSSGTYFYNDKWHKWALVQLRKVHDKKIGRSTFQEDLDKLSMEKYLWMHYFELIDCFCAEWATAYLTEMAAAPESLAVQPENSHGHTDPQAICANACELIAPDYNIPHTLESIKSDVPVLEEATRGASVVAETLVPILETLALAVDLER
ncbi:hypothetical protein BJ508DRAFT_332976 [Ascobolus immersus RN42]|uniref:Uncharacterized protein n=1 Tax=Ascobolus immersus RN42 TaxID=1160509 RepID=A0A3N4HL69_ASCIM|nr:hypothetical protein BJ508DRAFT_332976 [Ascobolus immersus RN42]